MDQQKAVELGCQKEDKNKLILDRYAKRIGYRSLANLQLKGLGFLKLCRVGLEGSVDCLFELPRVRILDLSGNRITSLSEKVSQLTRLERLHLSHNRLTDVPDSLVDLPLLAKLNLSGNRLTKLPDRLGDCSSLKYLRVSCNLLETLPLSLCKLKSLTLHAQSNPCMNKVPAQYRTWATHFSVAIEYMHTVPRLQQASVDFLQAHRLARLESRTIYVDPDNVLASVPEWIAIEIAQYVFMARPPRIGGHNKRIDDPPQNQKKKKKNKLI